VIEWSAQLLLCREGSFCSDGTIEFQDPRSISLWEFFKQMTSCILSYTQIFWNSAEIRNEINKLLSLDVCENIECLTYWVFVAKQFTRWKWLYHHASCQKYDKYFCQKYLFQNFSSFVSCSTNIIKSFARWHSQLIKLIIHCRWYYFNSNTATSAIK